MDTLFHYLVIASAHAQPLPLPGQVTTVSSGRSITDFICNTVLSWLFTIAILFSILMVLLAAYRYMTSAGDPGKVKEATNRLVFAAIGVAVAILARTLPILVGSIFVSTNIDPCRTSGTGTTTTMVTTPATAGLLL